MWNVARNGDVECDGNGDVKYGGNGDVECGGEL